MRKLASLAAILFLVACAKPSLTRDEAQRLLAASKKYPKAVRTTKVPAGEQGGCLEHPDLEEPLVSFLGDELVRLESGLGGHPDPRCPGGKYYEYLYSLTPEGEKYVESWGRAEDDFVVVKQCVAELGQVTGVSTEKDGLTARAQYSTRIVQTPFNAGEPTRCDPARDQTAIFRRYDDGWRLEREVEQ